MQIQILYFAASPSFAFYPKSFLYPSINSDEFEQSWSNIFAMRKIYTLELLMFNQVWYDGKDIWEHSRNL